MISDWWRRAAVVSATALTLSPAPGFTQGAAPPTVRAHRVTDPIRLDGRLDEPLYAATPAITDFVQQEPDEFKPATEKPEAWIFFDDDNMWSHLAPVPRALTTFRGILKVSSAGTLEGLQVPSAGRNLELKPYALAGVSTDRTVTPLVSNHPTGRMGGDLKFGITQSLTADLTVNTYFSQVEVDEQQVNLTRFDLFFPEKREFFLEGLGTCAFAGRASSGVGAGAGDTPYLFFTRRIGLDTSRVIPLRVGGRVNGKAGKVTFGAINVQTGEEAAAKVEAANFTVLRAKRDILRRSSIGGLFTHRTATPGRTGSNDGAGVDVAMSFYQNIRLDAYLAGTRTEGRDGDNLSYRGFFDYNADRFGVQLERLVVEPNFLPEIGFVRRTDMRRNFAQARDNLRPASIHNLRKITTQASLAYVTNNQNRLDTREGVGLLQVELTNSDVASVTYTDNFDRLVRPFAIATGVTIPIGAYTFHTTRIGYIAGQQRRVSGEVVFETGPFYNGDHTAIAVNGARMQVTLIVPDATMRGVRSARGCLPRRGR